jgi:hypothetical protein
MFAIRQVALVAALVLAVASSTVYAVEQDERGLLPKLRPKAKKVNELKLLDTKTNTFTSLSSSKMTEIVIKTGETPSFNVNALTSNGMQRVEYTLQSGKKFTATSAPFAMCGANAACPELGFGVHTVTAKAFPCRRCNGGRAVSATFVVLAEAVPVVTSPPATNNPIAPSTAAPVTSAPTGPPATAAPVTGAPVTCAPVTAAPN